MHYALVIVGEAKVVYFIVFIFVKLTFHSCENESELPQINTAIYLTLLTQITRAASCKSKWHSQKGAHESWHLKC
jgi:hypothetical protein